MLRTLGILFLFVFLYSAFALAQDQPTSTMTLKAEAWNKVCPVDGKAVNPEIKVITYKDHKYGFCGESCAGFFKENPETYAKNLSDDGTEFIGQSEAKNSQENK